MFLIAIYFCANILIHLKILGFRSTIIQDGYFSCTVPHNFVSNERLKTEQYIIMYQIINEVFTFLTFAVSVFLYGSISYKKETSVSYKTDRGTKWFQRWSRRAPPGVKTKLKGQIFSTVLCIFLLRCYLYVLISFFI